MPDWAIYVGAAVITFLVVYVVGRIVIAKMRRALLMRRHESAAGWEMK